MKEKILGHFSCSAPAVCSAGEEPAEAPKAERRKYHRPCGRCQNLRTSGLCHHRRERHDHRHRYRCHGALFPEEPAAGRLRLVASSVGYRSAEQTVEISPDKTIEVNFSLTEEALSVEEVVVSASRTETNKKTSPTIVSVASAKLFESTASCNLAETMNFQSGLRVETNCGNCGTTQLRINGLEGQYSQVLLDSRPDLQFAGIGLRP